MLVTISFKSLTYYEVTLQCEWSSKYENFNGVFLEIYIYFFLSYRIYWRQKGLLYVHDDEHKVPCKKYKQIKKKI